MQLLKDLLDLFLPPLCFVCTRRLLRDENILCNDCYSRIRDISSPYCKRCGRPVLYQNIKVCNLCIKEGYSCEYIRGISPYDGVVENLITLLKYSKKRVIAKVLGRLMAERVSEDEIYKKCDVIVPVPLHYSRKRERGFNQAEDLGREMGKILGIPFIKNGLIRVRATPSQTKLSPKERFLNVKGAFLINEKRLNAMKDRTILLIDDVFTTGATMNECAKALKEGEVGEVSGIVCAIA